MYISLLRIRPSLEATAFPPPPHTPCRGAADGFDFDPQALFDEAHDAFAAEHGEEGNFVSAAENPFNFVGQPPPGAPRPPGAAASLSVAPEPDALSMLRGGIRQSSAPVVLNGWWRGSETVAMQQLYNEYEEHEHEHAEQHNGAAEGFP